MGRTSATELLTGRNIGTASPGDRSVLLGGRRLLMADRLFHDYGGLPARAVFVAIGRARRALAEQGIGSPEAAEVEELARRELAELMARRQRAWWFEDEAGRAGSAKEAAE